jgi:hypothetical protein
MAATAANGVAVTSPRVTISPGSRVVFDVDVERLHFFDPDTHLTIASRTTTRTQPDARRRARHGLLTGRVRACAGT